MANHEPTRQIATVGDAARSKLPLSRRLGFWNNWLILTGWVLVLSSFLVGGLVGQEFPLRLSMPIIFFGTLCNGIVGVLIGVAAARTGYSSALLYRYSYGRSGVVLPNVIMGVVNMGWFAVILNLTRDGFADQVNAAPWSPIWITATVVIGGLFMLPGIVKIRWMAYIDWFAVPGFLAILGVVLVMTLQNAGGFLTLWDKNWTPKMSVMAGFDMAAGGWLVGVTIIGDLARFWKNGKHAALGIMTAYAGFVTIQYWGGAIGAAHTGDFNIFLITNALGLGMLAWVALWFGAQSTMQGGVYASGLAFSAPPFPIVRNQEFMRRLATTLAGVFGFLGSFLGLDQLANWWVGFLAWIVSPIAITVILDYWAFPERRRRYEDVRGADMRLNPAAFVAWIAGFAAGYFTGTYQLFSGLITSMATAGIIYYVWMRLALARGTTPERQLGLKEL